MKKTKKMIINEPFPLNLLEMITYGKEKASDVPKELSRDIINGINYALSRLSDREKNFLHLRYEKRKKYKEIAAHLKETEVSILKIEKEIFSKLQMPYLWNYMCYGILGNAERVAEQAYKRGFENGYRCGVQDERNGLVDEKGNYDPMKLPISNMRLPSKTLNCLKKAGFTYVGEIAALSRQKIETIKYLGPSGRSIIAYALYRLGMEHTEWACY